MSEDPRFLVGEGLVAAFAAAAAALWLCGAPGRTARDARSACGAVLGIGAGFYAGCWRMHLLPHWPPKVEQDRLLIILFPAVVAVEMVATFVRRRRAVIALLRALVVVGAARVLLHNTVYLSDLSGPHTAEWTPATAAMILAGLAGALAVLWTLLAVLMTRAPGRSVPLALALTCAGAAIVVMLSGYAAGLLLGLALAAALAGVLAAALVLGQAVDLRGTLGPGVVGLFALVVIGHFFGSLSLAHAGLVFAAPLLCWLPELVPVGERWRSLRGLARVALVAIPVSAAVVSASRGPDRQQQPESGSNTATIDDYSNFRP